MQIKIDSLDQLEAKTCSVSCVDTWLDVKCRGLRFGLELGLFFPRYVIPCEVKGEGSAGTLRCPNYTS